MAFSLERTLLTLLFGAAGPLSAKDIQRVFARFHEQRDEAAQEAPEGPPNEGSSQAFLEADGMPTSEAPSLISISQIREAMERIAAGLEERDEVFRLVERQGGYLLTTAPGMGEWARLLRDEPRPAKLARPALETLAVVAYRQPVTRAEIEKIRGVSADSALGKLLERELVQVVGRANLPGRPMQYGTTDAFLDFVGAKSIEELPQSDALSPRQVDEWLREASSGKKVGEKEMGLPEEETPETGAGSAPSETSAEADSEAGEEPADPSDAKAAPGERASSPTEIPPDEPRRQEAG